MVLTAPKNTFRAPFDPIIFKIRQKSLRMISLKLDNSHQNNLDTGKRKNVFLILG